MLDTPKIIVALDYPNTHAAFALLDQLQPTLCRIKIGKELFTSAGPAFVEAVIARGFDVFLDLKFHDIPNTVAKACSAAAEMGVWMVNVHALGGSRMMAAAREAIDKASHKPFLIAVTVLTSHSDDDLHAIGLAGTAQENVLRLVNLAHSAGLDGVVCSPMEVAMIRANLGKDFLLVTPGVRPLGASLGDQVRVMTPVEALRVGADYLVIGRPITASDHPLETLLTIQKDIAYI